ncbi:MAG: hypothetical protein KME60_29150 [Cyanomargarita calcarea GSE-NOS-MK-12-04C]|jgi:hypothetical protein|uniref:Uncharacterized protein n=1 Tax=Cyanomargarita calcarea GSE-NOS-MK-12-04C TaxID=2839659 RepID=A0A951QRZ9_9CYAN|nr:hypothetical protein [Cyanomargarita calcarea GSE-NOS-MK-12-04C]
MRVWIACFFVLFALAEFFDWVKEISLPLPIYILGGAFLAVASNYDKIVGLYFHEGIDPTQQAQLDSSSQVSRPISFTIPQKGEGLQLPKIND